MDAIDRAISSGRHLTHNKMLISQTWKKFEQVSTGKAVFLFGIGDGADFYFYKYEKNARLEGIIDNEKSLWGCKAEELISEELGEKCQNIIITDISVLSKYSSEDVVVLITSLIYYEEIAKQLEIYKIYQYFAVLPMEANERKRWVDCERKDRITNYIEEGHKAQICENKIVLFTMCDCAGHGKEIVKQLLKLRDDLDVVWIVKNLHTEAPVGVRLVSERNKRKYIYELETALMWICDTVIPTFLMKRSGQIYIQVKHWSSVTLKAFGFDLAKFRKDERMLATCEHDSKLIDYIITGSEFDTETCRKGFLFSGEIFQAGSCRSDILFYSEKYRKKICEYYLLDRNKKFLLYAPTFRSKTGKKYIPQASHIDLDFAKVKAGLESRFGGDWRILLRLHPAVSTKSKELDKPEYVVDVSSYYDSQELVAASDVLITDYSSIMFEPAFIKKPVFLLSMDRNEYIDGERTLLIDYNSLPFAIAETNDELIENITQFDRKQYEDTIQKFFKRYGVHEDGHAGERAARFIEELFRRKLKNIP